MGQMKLWGKVSVIEELEQVIIKEGNHRLGRDGGINGSGQGDDRSRVFSRLYELQLNGTMVAVKLGFDYRDMTGEVHIRDDKIWKVAVQMPGLVVPFSRLKPFYTYFGGRRFV